MSGSDEGQAYETIRVRFDGPVCTLQLHRPTANNTISELMAEECLDFLTSRRDSIRILVLEGLPEVF